MFIVHTVFVTYGVIVIYVYVDLMCLFEYWDILYCVYVIYAMYQYYELTELGPEGPRVVTGGSTRVVGLEGPIETY